MSDDDRNVSAREWRAVREGDTHPAPKTSSNNTPESFIVGVGASGALLAGAAIVFVTLVGLVSFNVWPTVQNGSTDGNVELSAATPRVPVNNTVVPVSAAAGQLASANVGTSTGSGGGGNAGNGGNGGKNQGGKSKPAPAPTPPNTSPTPPDTGGSTGTGDGSTGSDQGGPVGAVKDPTPSIRPTHPSHPHQSEPAGEKGKDPGLIGGGSVGVTGKPPFIRPPDLPTILPGKGTSEPSDGDGSSDPSQGNGPSHPSHGNGHGCSHSHR
jgi:hypothetical protein